jgi:phage-related minor tail protein
MTLKKNFLATKIIILALTFNNANAQMKNLSDDAMYRCAFLAAFFQNVWKDSAVPQEKEWHKEAVALFGAYRKFSNEYIRKNNVMTSQVEATAKTISDMEFETKINLYQGCRANPRIVPYFN